ncbi:MAG: hypothetical protein HKO57_02760, partial [Akkermansiaceae bacterium]|nr:hypothetical protein [Akkermansiaceae bacterium]
MTTKIRTKLMALLGLILATTLSHAQGTFDGTTLTFPDIVFDGADVGYIDGTTPTTNTRRDKWFYEYNANGGGGAGASKGQSWTTTTDGLLKAVTFRLNTTNKPPEVDYLFRVGPIDPATNTFYPIHQETITQTTPWGEQGVTTDSFGRWTLDVPVELPALPAGTYYGFDLTMTSNTTAWQQGIPYPMLSDGDEFPGGNKFTCNNVGSAGNPGTLVSNDSNRDREFHLDMDATTISDTTAPTLLSIDDGVGGGPIFEDVSGITYTLTFDDAVDEGTIDLADFENLGTGVSIDGVASVVLNTPFPVASVVDVTLLVSGTGTLQLNVKDQSISDHAGNLFVGDFADTTIITINSGTTTDTGIRYWDGGTTDDTTLGNGASEGGTGTWIDSTIANWDRGAGFAHVKWDNGNIDDTAFFAGSNGTVTLGSDISLGTLVMDDVSSTLIIDDGANYSLNFAPGGGILMNDPSANREMRIRPGVTGSPAVTMNAGEYLRLDCQPGLLQDYGDVTLQPRVNGTADNLLRIYTTGSGNCGSFDSLNIVTTNNGQRATVEMRNNGEWTIDGDVDGTFNSRLRLHLFNSGRLIVTGNITNTELRWRSNTCTLELQQPGDLTTVQTRIDEFRGILDNTSGSLITFAGNPTPINCNGPFTLDGSSVDVGTGSLSLGNGIRNMTVDDTTSVLTFGGPVTNTGGITKQGPGTLELKGDNTYTGNTIAEAGTLALVGGSQTSEIFVEAGALLGLTIDSTTVSTAGLTLDPGHAVRITGTPTAASHVLMTASAITGTPVLESPIAGYELVVDSGTTLVLNQTGGASAYDTWAAANGLTGGAGSATDPALDADGDAGGKTN